MSSYELVRSRIDDLHASADAKRLVPRPRPARIRRIRRTVGRAFIVLGRSIAVPANPSRETAAR